ncbi:MAG TPA: hypothetical protein V6D33_08500 [Cyanophyceae cyanobacterium]
MRDSIETISTAKFLTSNGGTYRSIQILMSFAENSFITGHWCAIAAVLAELAGIYPKMPQGES